LAIRGLPVAPRDVDLKIDDAWLAGRLLDDLLVAPVERVHGWTARIIGRAFEHATIEWHAQPLALACVRSGSFIEALGSA
jgi:hypothetical protein